MCGIFGFAKKHNSQNDNQILILRRILTNLADESVVRGQDSTGVSVITPDDRRTFKATYPSSELIRHETWKSNILERVTRDTTIVIGHVRYATHGAISTRNAHPFEIGEVIGAHNGVIYNYNKIADKYGKEVEVDSEVIFASLNRNDKRIAFEDLSGDFAVSWIKESNEILHLARELSRPICVAYWKKAKVLLWASTLNIMSKALKRSGLKIKYRALEADYIFSFNTSKFGDKPDFDKIEFESMSQWGSESYGSWGGHSYGTGDIAYTGGANPVYSGSQGPEDAYKPPVTKTDYDYDYLKKDGDRDRCEICDIWYPSGDIKKMGVDFKVCEDCYDDVRECQWCGDYRFQDELFAIDQWKVCEGCKPDIGKQLMLEEHTVEGEA
jgi:predicted glutamine amidotransferase